jgi:hypothetical protein
VVEEGGMGSLLRPRRTTWVSFSSNSTSCAVVPNGPLHSCGPYWVYVRHGPDSHNVRQRSGFPFLAGVGTAGRQLRAARGATPPAAPASPRSSG